ncbi:MAG: PP2C family protein-serine/threonine phosphatase [Candidatus Aminicenantes bacterium]|nr:PP2C family protein-serine/threonine phosphatase [Candidatus Aminicenantes bacterium]
MATGEVKRLRKELKFKKLQLNSIYELSSAMQAQFDVDYVMRIFFSSLMAPLGLSRTFLYDRANGLFRKRGFVLSAEESQLLKKGSARALSGAASAKVEELPESLAGLQKLLLARKIHTLLNISEKRRRPVVLGLGRKFNLRDLDQEDFEFAHILSRFMLVELDIIRYLAQILEKKKLEHEMKIARTIQQSLLPQERPRLEHYDLSVIYEPIQEVGGDYYDFLKRRKNIQPLVLADVEGKGLAAALLAASCQAVFHSMNELYLFRPAQFVGKANDFIHEITRGRRFITLFWMLLNDETPALTYVNAGHSVPLLVSRSGVRRLDAGGLLLGFTPRVAYEERTIPLAGGDVVCVFTDGVLEAQNPTGAEFGEASIADYLCANRQRTAAELGDGLMRRIRAFGRGVKLRDDFTVLIVKVRETGSA